MVDINKEKSNFTRPMDLANENSLPALKKYQRIAVGNERLIELFKYEIIQTLFSNITGAAGIFLRQKFYKFLFNKMGEKIVIGKGVCLRQPRKISVGKGSLIDDYSRITVAGSESANITIAENVFIGPYTIISSKNANIEIKKFANLGSHCRIASTGKISLGEYALIASYCYIGAESHHTDSIDKPIALQGLQSKGGIVVGDGAWIGANVTILDGVTIGNGSIVGAGSVVLKDIPPFSIAYGVPAKVKGKREG